MTIEPIVYSYTTKEVALLSHPNLTEAKQTPVNGKPQGKFKYSANFIMDVAGQDWVALKRLAGACAKAQWPSVSLSSGEIEFSFKDGTKEADKRKTKLETLGKPTDGEFSRGKGILKAASDFIPALCHFDAAGQVVDYGPAELAQAKKDAYFGSMVYVKVTFRAYDIPQGDKPSKKYVATYLDQVLITGQGKKLSGAKPASETFKGYVGGAIVEDPTEGLDDDIAF